MEDFHHNMAILLWVVGLNDLSWHGYMLHGVVGVFREKQNIFGIWALFKEH